MNAKTLYEIYKTTEESDLPDLTIGLAMLKDEHPEIKITHEEDRAIREFIGSHGQELAKAFPDKEKFAAAVAQGMAADAEQK